MHLSLIKYKGAHEHHATIAYNSLPAFQFLSEKVLHVPEDAVNFIFSKQPVLWALVNIPEREISLQEFAPH